MKKIIIVLLAAALITGSAFAQFVQDEQNNIEISGELKTGFFVVERQAGDDSSSFARIHNNDGDAGDSEGRIRFGVNAKLGNFGLRTQFYQNNFKRLTGKDDTDIIRTKTDFIYAYGDIFDEQLRISAGLLGESPWGSGGSELFKELEYTPGGDPITGIRFEWTPNFLPGLNLGFVVNRDDDTVASDAVETFGDIFKESVLGVTYGNDYFAFTFAYRFDRGLKSEAAIITGAKLLYRVEARVLGTLVPGLSVWANGYCLGIAAEGGSGRKAGNSHVQNWLYILYDPEFLSAGINVGYRDEFELDNKFLEFRPFFFAKLLNNFLNVGFTAGMEMGFTDTSKVSPDAAYNFWFVEPQVKLNVTGNFYAAAVYRFTAGKYGLDYPTLDQTTHWFNLRLCYTF